MLVHQILMTKLLQILSNMITFLKLVWLPNPHILNGQVSQFKGGKDFLEKLKSVFNDNKEIFAQIISREMGKPIWEARTEAGALGAKIDITLKHSLSLVSRARLLRE